MGTQNQTTTQLRGTQILDKSITQNDITLSGITKTNVISEDNIIISNANELYKVNLPEFIESIKAGFNISLSGTLSVSTTGYVKWSDRYIISSSGNGNHFSTNGYFYIETPLSGTITGVGGASNVTATSDGIPLSDWQSLYYILPIGSDSTSLSGNFRVVSTSSTLVIPHNWILLCTVNGLNHVYFFSNGVKLNKSQSIDLSINDSVNADKLDGFHLNEITGNSTTFYDGRYVNINGDTMTGTLNVDNTQSTNPYNDVYLFNTGEDRTIYIGNSSNNTLHLQSDYLNIGENTDTLNIGIYSNKLSIGYGTYDTKIGEYTYNLSIGNGTYDTKIGENSNNLSIGYGTYNVSIGEYTYNLNIGDSSNILSIGGGLYNKPQINIIGEPINITGNTKITGNVTGATFVKSGGTSSQFLKADGTVDSNTYVTPTYSGNITATAFIKSGGTSSQFLKANGSVDSNSYIPASAVSSLEVNTAKKLIIDNTIVNGSSGLQFAQYSGGDNPGGDWYSHLIMNHDNPNGYYVDLLANFHSDVMYMRRKVNGVVSTDRRFMMFGDNANLSALTVGTGNNAKVTISDGGYIGIDSINTNDNLIVRAKGVGGLLLNYGSTGSYVEFFNGTTSNGFINADEAYFSNNLTVIGSADIGGSLTTDTLKIRNVTTGETESNLFLYIDEFGEVKNRIYNGTDNNKSYFNVLKTMSSGTLTLQPFESVYLTNTLRGSSTITIVLDTTNRNINLINEYILKFKTGNSVPTLFQPTSDGGVKWRGAIPVIYTNESWTIVYEYVLTSNTPTWEIWGTAVKNV